MGVLESRHAAKVAARRVNFSSSCIRENSRHALAIRQSSPGVSRPPSAVALILQNSGYRAK
jgi:hypothetical protein